MSTRTRTVPPWLTIAVLSMCGSVASLQQTLVIPLLPDLPRLLGVSTEDASWLITATLLMSAVATPIVSRMADMYGKRRMLVVSLVVMTIGCALCALGAGFALMILGRAMQGFASALIPVGISILRDELPQERIGSAVALMSATLGIGAGLGLPLSGLMTNTLGWHSIFWLSGLAGVLLIVGLYLVVPESTVRTSGRFDVIGGLLLTIALIALLLPISKGASWGWTSPEVLGLFGLCLLSLAVWIPFELRTNQPMVDLRTFVRRPVLLTNVSSIFVGLAMFTNMLLTIQILELPEFTGFGFGLSVLVAGLWMVPNGLVMAVISPFTGRLLNRFGGRVVLIAGSAVMSGAYVLRLVLDNSPWEVALGSTLVGIGTAVAFAAMPTLIMASVPITETASANGINSLVRAIGTSSASAVLAMVLGSMTIEFDGVPYPTQEATHLLIWLAATVALLGALVAAFIPRETTRKAAEALKAAARAGEETVVRGRIALGEVPAGATPAIVTVLDLQGNQVDWTRADRDGRYSVALPGPGSYVAIANAQGWVPRAEMFRVTGSGAEQHLTLVEELTLSGRITRAGEPVPGATVALTLAGGGHAGTIGCDADGRYRLPLPPAGRYLLTAFDPFAGQARSAKVVLDVQSATVDLDLMGRAAAGQPVGIADDADPIGVIAGEPPRATTATGTTSATESGANR